MGVLAYPEGMPTSPLITYLRIQQATDRQVLAALRISATSVSNELRRLQSRTGAGSVVRREQLLRSQAAIQRELEVLYTRVGDIVKAQSAGAAAAGAESILSSSESLLKNVLSQSDYDYLMRSARASAEQSLEVLRQRVSGSSYVPLAESVWDNQARANSQVQNIINSALARGASAAELARDVRAFVNPNTPGGLRYASMRLARTELNNAFHAAQVKQAQEEPWTTGVKWHLSGSHPVPDACNDYAEKSHTKDGPAGVWDPEDVPAKPHPNCLCYTTPVTDDPEEFINKYLSGHYDSYLEEQGLPSIAAEAPVSVQPNFPALADPGALRNTYRGLERQRPGGLYGYSNAPGVEWYKGYGFTPMNSFLRTGKAVDSAGLPAPTAKVKSSITSMDSAFKKSSVALPEDTTVLRGLTNLDVSGFTAGEYIVEAGYSSTTMAKDIAERFSRGTLSGSGQGEGWIVEIMVPKGTRALVPGNVTGEEYELILARNSRFKIAHIDESQKRVWMELER